MKLYAVPAGPIETNAWLLLDKEAGSAVLFDAPPQSYDIIMDILNEENCKLAALFITHGHWDHMLDTYRFASDNVPVYGHEEGREFMEHPETMSNYAMPGLTWKGCSISDNVTDGENIKIGSFDFLVRYTPGHCPGSIAIVIDRVKSVIVGDVIFRGSIGRTDLPGGSFNVLSENITRKLYSLPEDYKLCPGHGPETTVGLEKKSNPFVRGE